MAGYDFCPQVYYTFRKSRANAPPAFQGMSSPPPIFECFIDETFGEAMSLGYKHLSDYMDALISKRNGVKPAKKNRKLAPVGKGGKRAETRVTPAEKQKLVAYCAEENESESAVILRQIRILLMQPPHFTREELKALRLATTQLTAIGRNLNQITAKINSGKITDSILSKNYILKIKGYIDLQVKNIRLLIMKTQNRVVK